MVLEGKLKPYFCFETNSALHHSNMNKKFQPIQTLVTETLEISSGEIALVRIERSAHPTEFHLRQQNELGFYTIVYQNKDEAIRAWNNLHARMANFRRAFSGRKLPSGNEHLS